MTFNRSKLKSYKINVFNLKIHKLKYNTQNLHILDNYNHSNNKYQKHTKGQILALD